MSGERRIIIPPGAFNQCYRPCLSAGQFRQIYFGGAGSGKSVFLAGRAALDALTGRNTLIVRQVARTLRHSCFNEVQKAAHRLGIRYRLHDCRRHRYIHSDLRLFAFSELYQWCL